MWFCNASIGEQQNNERIASKICKESCGFSLQKIYLISIFRLNKINKYFMSTRNSYSNHICQQAIISIRIQPFVRIAIVCTKMYYSMVELQTL